jgi:hypothetical protein
MTLKSPHQVLTQQGDANLLLPYGSVQHHIDPSSPWHNQLTSAAPSNSSLHLLRIRAAATNPLHHQPDGGHLDWGGVVTQKMMLKHAMGEVAGYGQDEEGAVLPRCAGVKDRHGHLAGGGRTQMSQPGLGAH